MTDEEIREVEGPWTCFHCGETFTNVCCAELHFGINEKREPACKIKNGAELHLVEHIRDIENQLEDYRTESNRILVAWSSKNTEHQQALRQAEESGYNKGVQDMREAAEELARALEAMVEHWEPECAGPSGRMYNDAKTALARYRAVEGGRVMSRSGYREETP